MGKKTHVGVDIGSGGIRVAEVTAADADGYVKVVRAHIEPLPDKALAGGEIVDNITVGNALRSAVKNAKVTSGFVLGLTTRRSAVATIDVPVAVKPSEYEQYLRNSGKEISTLVSLRDAALSWQQASEIQTASGAKVNRLIVAAAHKSDVRRLLDICEVADVRPAAIDLAGAAILRAVARTREGAGDVETVVDIGAGKTTIATREGAHLRSLRIVPQGGTHITRDLMGPLGVGFDEAEQRKRQLRIPTATDTTHREASLYLDIEAGPSRDAETDVGSTLAEAAERLALQVRASVDADAEAHSNRRSKRMLLTGQGALLRGLPELIADRADMDVRLGPPWASLSRTKRTAGALGTADEADQQVMFELSVAIGLSMWKDT